MVGVKTKELRRRRATLLGVVLAPEDSVNTRLLMEALTEMGAIDREIARRQRCAPA